MSYGPYIAEAQRIPSIPKNIDKVWYHGTYLEYDKPSVKKGADFKILWITSNYKEAIINRPSGG